MSLGWMMDDIIINLFLNKEYKASIRHTNNVCTIIEKMRFIFTKDHYETFIWKN